MPQQPDDKERQEVAVPEPDGEDGNAAIASVVSSIVLILAFIAAWAGATGHYTTLLIAVALGIASVTISAYFGWPPNKVARSTGDLIDKVVTALLSAAPKSPLVEADTEAQPIPFEVEHDRLAKEVVRLRIQNERLLEARKKELETTELQNGDSVNETIKPPSESLPSIDKPSQNIQLDKEQEQILRILFQCSALQIGEVQSKLNLSLQFALYHLEELERHRFVIKREHILPRIGTRYQITQPGREFVIRNNLLNRESQAPLEPFTDPKTVVVNAIPFDTLPPRWLKYTEDKFHKIIWRWHYTPDFDSEPEPHGVTPFCPECQREMGGYRYTDGRTGGFAVRIECNFHPSINLRCDYDDFAHIRKLIRQKIDDGSYDEVVTRLRANRPGWISN